MHRQGCLLLSCCWALLLQPVQAATDAAGSTGIGPAWEVVVPRDQAIRLLRTFEEATPDAATPRSGQIQVPQGVNPWAAMLVHTFAMWAAIGVERKTKGSENELIVPTDQAAGGTVALADSSSARRFGSQDDANAALAPYVAALSGTSLHDLLAVSAVEMHALNLSLRTQSTVTDGGDRSIHVAPRLVFSADQRSISAQTVVGFGRVADLSAAGSAPARNALVVQVHSQAGEGIDITEHWLQGGAQKLRNTFASLVIRAVDLARRYREAAPHDSTAPQSTFRFQLGAERHYVRGWLAHADCDHLTVRTLEGPLVALPSKALRDLSQLPPHCRHGR